MRQAPGPSHRHRAPALEFVPTLHRNAAVCVVVTLSFGLSRDCPRPTLVPVSGKHDPLYLPVQPFPASAWLAPLLPDTPFGDSWEYKRVTIGSLQPSPGNRSPPAVAGPNC